MIILWNLSSRLFYVWKGECEKLILLLLIVTISKFGEAQRKVWMRFSPYLNIKLLFSALLVVYLKWYHLLNSCGWKQCLKTFWFYTGMHAHIKTPIRQVSCCQFFKWSTWRFHFLFCHNYLTSLLDLSGCCLQMNPLLSLPDLLCWSFHFQMLPKGRLKTMKLHSCINPNILLECKANLSYLF